MLGSGTAEQNLHSSLSGICWTYLFLQVSDDRITHHHGDRATSEFSLRVLPGSRKGSLPYLFLPLHHQINGAWMGYPLLF